MSSPNSAATDTTSKDSCSALTCACSAPRCAWPNASARITAAIGAAVEARLPVRSMNLDHTAAVAEFALQDTPAPAAVARRSGSSAAQFRSEHLLPRIPVILTDAAVAWPIYAQGPPDYFRRVHVAQIVRVLGQPCR